MNESELKFCPDCGTMTLEVEFGFNKVHCAKCGNFFTLFIEPTSIPRKGYLLVKEESKDPNEGKSAFQIASTNPSTFGYKEKRKFKV